jgi:glycosyltransferase involved in cell wall biosynthesis
MWRRYIACVDSAFQSAEQQNKRAMKILLVGNYAPDRQYSMLGFAGALRSGLPECGLEVRTITPRAVIGRLRVPKAAKWLAYADKFLVFPRELRSAVRWADVVHLCDQGNAVYTRYLQDVPHVVTCHDLLAIRSALGELADQHTGPTGRIYQNMILSGLKRAQYVACVSGATQRDLLRIAPRMQTGTCVVYNGLYRRFDPVPAGEASIALTGLRLAPDDTYVLHVGGNQFYKNRKGVLDIYAALRKLPEWSTTRLVMAGKPMTPELKARVDHHRLAGHVIEAANPTDDQVHALYSRALALIFPSLFEGFGLPVIEAQACGCPVFASNRAPMTEIGGDAAVYFDPAMPEQAAGIVAEHLDCLPAMRAKGIENARRFSTERMLEGYVAAYRHVIESAQQRAA